MKYEKLHELFDHLAAIKPIAPQISNQQKPGNSRNVFLLEKSGEHYFLMPSPLFEGQDSQATNLQMPNFFDCTLLYAILAEYPQQVMVGLPYRLSFDPTRGTRDQFVDGHSSITLLHDVLYAGGLTFEGDRLVKWSNLSGHYKPPRSRHMTQLTPNVKRLLPEALFCGYY